MTREDKEYLNERFDAFGKLINAHFQNVEDKLERIETQTTKTNGRVTLAENKINELERKELTHIQTCPQAPKVEKINEELSEYRLFIKHPKLGIAIIAGAVLLFIATTFAGIEKAKKNFTEENQAIVKELVQEIQTMTDTLQLW